MVYLIFYDFLSCGFFNMDIFYLYIIDGRIVFILLRKDDFFYCVLIKYFFFIFSGDRSIEK